MNFWIARHEPIIKIERLCSRPKCNNLTPITSKETIILKIEVTIVDLILIYKKNKKTSIKILWDNALTMC